MKSFIKITAACLVALMLASTLSFIGFFAVIGAISTMSTSSITEYSSQSMLHIKLDYPVVEDPNQNPLLQINPYTFNIDESVSLTSLLSSIDSASEDSKIAGIYLDLTDMSLTNMSQISDIRNAIIRFKSSGKSVYAYSDYYSHASYFLATVADKIFMPELGSMQWQGLASQTMFFKGTLKKLGIEPEIVRHGRYKSAIESFTQDKMSSDNRKQTERLVGSIWNYMVDEISKARSIESKTLQNYASTLAIRTSEDAQKLGLIDSVKYQHEVESYIASSLSTDKFESIKDIDYLKLKSSNETYSENKIALIYAEGEIVASSSGGGSSEIVGSQIIQKIEKATEDDAVKSVVIRINSPGGSALVADNIWAAIKELHTKKPVIVSMGEVAASGGYYIAAPADIILADPTTITGSIGVFGIMINAKEALNDKLGVTIDGVLTNRYADMGTITRPLSTAEYNYLQKGVEQVYDTFIAKVAEGRNLSKEKVNEVAQGRVWSGIDAKEVGLIDGFGDINSAIMIAADRAGIASSFRVDVMRSELSGIDLLIDNLTGGAEINLGSNSIFNSRISSEFDKIKRQYSKANSIVALMPYTIYFE